MIAPRASSTDSFRSRFVGMWRLLASEFRRQDGSVLHPFGADAVGLLQYAPEGIMSVQIMRADRGAFRRNDQFAGEPEEIRRAFEGYIAYFGRYDVDVAREIVLHHIEGSWFPNWVGQIHQRFARFEENRLTLTTPPFMGGREVLVGALVWERMAG